MARPFVGSATAGASAAAETALADLAAAPPRATACSTAQAAGPATIEVTAGTAEVVVNGDGKVKKIGARLGLWVDILLLSAVPSTAADPACRIKVKGAIKPGATRPRTIPAEKLTACYAALQLADCSQPLQLRVTANAGKRLREGRPSKPAPFMPSCAPCSG